MDILKKNERIDQLYAQDVKIIQSNEVFSFSLDAVLLANFANVPKKGKIVDLCAGNGAVTLFLSRKTTAEIVGFELQERLADMATRSILLNDLAPRISVVAQDIKKAPKILGKELSDVVTCNPPYFPSQTTSKKNPNPYLALARHEIATNFEEVAQVTSQLLKNNGHAFFVHRPDRLVELCEILVRHNLAPKKIRFVHPKMGREANMVLIEAKKDGSTTGLKVLPPLFIYSEANDYLPEVRKILYGE